MKLENEIPKLNEWFVHEYLDRSNILYSMFNHCFPEHLMCGHFNELNIELHQDIFDCYIELDNKLSEFYKLFADLEMKIENGAKND